MGALRISGGSLRGRKIPLPAGEVRATSARAREAYFNVVAPSIGGARFLDLYTGSGMFALEAASRGAGRIVAVDRSQRAVSALSALAREWNLPIETMRADAIQAIGRLQPAAPFDLVYVDPPWDDPGYAEVIETIDRRLPLEAGALVAAEHRSGALPFVAERLDRLHVRKRYRYGAVSITMLEAEGRAR
ncbi:MAG TPA: RsmD family RNA methyltransferase [Thermoanaerobaculia bacterium]|nr:RsmD family RNA methyltransferase [Thermoanaerobaculia bacterium]